jgi:hypothetical protein
MLQPHNLTNALDCVTDIPCIELDSLTIQIRGPLTWLRHWFGRKSTTEIGEQIHYEIGEWAFLAVRGLQAH